MWFLEWLWSIGRRFSVSAEPDFDQLLHEEEMEDDDDDEDDDEDEEN